MSSMMTEIAKACGRVLSPDNCRSMVLLGGYGRGEGGVVTVNGSERPHNNLDFLLITPSIPRNQQDDLKRQLHEALSLLTVGDGIEFDISCIDESKLRRSPSLVMWYDMRFGHKTIFGDANLVPSMKQFALERIPAWDILNLLVNRGTLLVINDRILASRALRPEDRKRVVKHAMKAIIGYGDALLFSLGRYDWSYVEKQKRMRDCVNVPQAFRELYNEAVEFRFQPAYEAYAGRDLASWMDELRTVFAPIHLRCEQQRLHQNGMNWDTYVETVWRRAPWDDLDSPRAWAKKVLNFIRTPSHLAKEHSMAARIGHRTLGLRGILPTLFPVVAYDIEDRTFKQTAALCLRARSMQPDELRRAYLLMWGTVIEPAFLHLARKWEIALEAGIQT